MTENIQSDKTNIDDLIDLLPEQFPAAQEMINLKSLRIFGLRCWD